MRYGVPPAVLSLATLLSLACVPTPASDPVSSTGGNPSSGGISVTGGNVTTGGNTANGGSSTLGGNPATGGNSSNGGNANTGGNASNGGKASTGGNATNGGNPATGGTASDPNCTDTKPESNTCAQFKEWNNCPQQWMIDGNFCNKTCGRCSGTVTPVGGSTSTGGTRTGGGATNTGGSSSTGGTVTGPGATNPPMTDSTGNGWGSRYWDCCKPSCSWTTAVPACGMDGMSKISDRNAKSGCEGGSAYECYDFAPWYDSGTNMSYGFVAYNGSPCGTCFMFQFTGASHNGGTAGASALKGQQMIVQVINIGGLGGDQFDIMIPGGGVGDFPAGCKAQWGNVDFGATYGGLLTNCKNDPACMKGKCQSVFGNIPALKAGCDWFTGWYSSADNPSFQYKKVSCPQQITSKTGVSG